MAKMIKIPTASGLVTTYEAAPGGKYRGAVIVIHEVWGVDDHVKDVAERFAKEGYLAVAPDFLSDTIDIIAARELQLDLFNPKKRNDAQPKLRALMTPMIKPDFAAKTQAALVGIFDFLYSKPKTSQKVAVAGFCFGGTYSFSLAVSEPRLKLAVPFYGHSDHSIDELAKIKCPVRAFYGEKDENLMNGLPELKTKMKQAGVDFEAAVYPNCGHAFFNDTNSFAYNGPAAQDSWRKTLHYLQEYLA